MRRISEGAVNVARLGFELCEERVNRHRLEENYPLDAKKILFDEDIPRYLAEINGE